MIQYADLPSKEHDKKCSTDKSKKSFEPPMNTDEHRLKADKEIHFIQNKHDCGRHSVRIWHIASQVWAAVRVDPCALGWPPFVEFVVSPFALGKTSLGLVDQQRDQSFIFMSLSVFIGVHRWLEIFCFNLLNQGLSVDAFVGARDASVCA